MNRDIGLRPRKADGIPNPPAVQGLHALQRLFHQVARYGHDQVFILDVPVAPFPVTGYPKGRFAGVETSSNGIRTGRLPHAGKLHDLVPAELEGIDEEHHLGRIGVDQDHVGLEGVVHLWGHGHRFIFSQGEPRDGRFDLSPVLLGRHPHDASKGAVPIVVRQVGQADDGGT